MIHGVDTASQRVFLQQPSKASDEQKSASAKESAVVDRSSSLAEVVKNGDYKLDTEATARSLALYLLNKE
ncbi:MAG: hypothetical protein ACLFOC_06415 [Campylobacterales bacterium]